MADGPRLLTRNMVVQNTMGVASTARLGVNARNIDDVRTSLALAKEEGLDFVALGEGSNIIPHAIVEQFVCRIALTGIDATEEDSEQVLLRVAAGENWHNFVQVCLRRGWFGLENLSLIPGSVGAAPVQNIGAYGVEVATFIKSVDVLDAEGHSITLTRSDCDFAYRESIFKTRKDLVIVGVNLCLSKSPRVVFDYPELRNELAGIELPTPVQVAAAVIALRSRKLPDPRRTPNAGSFFKNPVVTAEHAARLRLIHAHLSAFEVPDGVKLSAAQLIDTAGWKDKTLAGVRCWQRQPLVLTNDEGATANEVLQFAAAIREDILTKFEVRLELEPYELS